MRIRADSKWNVPEPELALLLSPAGRIIGYTIGNDMSSRDIEGENPLYLPQAKVYDGSCAARAGGARRGAGAAAEIDRDPAGDPARRGERAFAGTTALSQMKRGLPELAGWLFRDSSFPTGCYLLTGTGIVPPDSFTLQPGDEVRITIEPIGTLSNVVA